MSYLTNLKDEFDYYIENKEFFLKKYEDKFVSIKNHSVICEADSREKAIADTLAQGYEMGTFLVQHISRKDDESIQRFHSRVYC